MILAVSRFRVANDTADAVANAFANRPGLVDAWPGFLGLETFRDVKDANLFYLVTRWTDAGSFREWHRSPAHRASHRWMPRGLHLDPAYTRLVELERLPGGKDTDAFTLTLDGAAAIARYLERTRIVHVMRLGLDGMLLFANEATGALFGMPSGDLIGTSVFDRLTEPDARRLRGVLAGEPAPEDPMLLNFCCDSGGDPTTLVCQVHATPRDCLIVAEPPYESDRDLQHKLLAVNQDLATLARERHRAIAAEQAARRVAESATRTKDEALAVIAHELRQPLSAATMALSNLEQLQRPEDLGRTRAILRRQLSQMTRLVEDLLDASNIMRGAIALQRQATDLRGIVQEGLEVLGPALRERDQRSSLSLPERAVAISADPLRVRQVLSNLLTNASKYTPPGGSISVSVERDDAWGVVRVRDTGRGIAPDVINSLFGLFVRASDDAGGLGIGLAVAKRLVELHGGRIEARSDGIGLGSKFVTRWPVTD